jgi:hypothetical protein
LKIFLWINLLLPEILGYDKLYEETGFAQSQAKFIISLTKTNMKQLIALVAVVSLAAMVVGTAALGATASVTATVTAGSVAVSVTDGAIAYGTILTSADTVTLSDTQTVHNDGNVAEDFTIKGSDTTNWTLGATAGDHVYKHEFSKTATFPGTALTTTDQSLATNVAATSGTQAVDFKITVPTSNAGTSQQNPNVTVTASAS